MAGESRVLKSCDTFVVLNPSTENGSVIFGKNSDRPKEEVQDIVFYPATEYPAGTLLEVLILFNYLIFNMCLTNFHLFLPVYLHSNWAGKQHECGSFE